MQRVEISLPPELAAQLERKANAAGKTLEELVVGALGDWNVNRPVVIWYKLKVDRLSRTVELDGKAVHVRPVVFKILELLALRAGEVATLNEISHSLWGRDYNDLTNGINVYVCNLNKMFSELSDKKRRLVQTVRSVGYRLNPKYFES